jgi:hypothetical protein
MGDRDGSVRVGFDDEPDFFGPKLVPVPHGIVSRGEPVPFQSVSSEVHSSPPSRPPALRIWDPWGPLMAPMEGNYEPDGTGDDPLRPSAGVVMGRTITYGQLCGLLVWIASIYVIRAAHPSFLAGVAMSVAAFGVHAMLCEFGERHRVT